MVSRIVARRPRALSRQRGYLGVGNRRVLGGSGAQTFAQFWSSPSFWAQLTTSIVPDHAAPGTAATFTRATTATVTDLEGVVRSALSGEARFQGARRVQNLATNTGLSGAVANTTAPTGWARIASGGTFAPSASTLNDNHQRLDFTVANNREIMSLTVNLVAGHTYVLSAFFEAIAGNLSDFVLHLVGVTATLSAGTPLGAARVLAGGAGKRYTTLSNYVCTVSGTATFRIGLGVGSNENGTGSISISHPQIEDVTGASNQNPSEYVSVGVLSSPFQGANVDGVQYFATQNGNTVGAANFDITQAVGPVIGQTRNQSAYVSGASGTDGFSTPDSVAASITGDLRLQALVIVPSWTAAATATPFISKTAVGAFSYQLSLNAATGLLSLGVGIASDSGAVFRAVNSAAVLTAANGTALWVRGDWSVTNGTATFYTSQDGVTWTQLGNVVNTGLTGSPLFDGAQVVNVGRGGTGGVGNNIVLRAQVFNGLTSAAPVVDFNPNDYATGNTWVSATTGETWTVLNNAKIVNNPLLGYLAEEQRTNLCLQSNNFSAAGWANANAGVPTITQNVIGPDGLLSAWTFTDADAANFAGRAQSITVAVDSLAYVITTYVLRTYGGTSATVGINFQIAGGTNVSTNLRLNSDTGVLIGGVGTVTSVYAGGQMWWKVSGTVTNNGTALNTTLTVSLFPATAANGSGLDVVTATGSAVFWSCQVEKAAFATSYIPTTTVAVTRNADVLSYNVGAIFSNGVTLYGEATPTELVNGNAYIGAVQLNANSNPTVALRRAGTTWASLARDAGGGVHDATAHASPPVVGSLTKITVAADAAGNVTGYANGLAAAAPGVGMTNLNQLNTLNAGNGYQSGWMNAPVRNIRVWAQAAPAAYQAQATA